MISYLFNLSFMKKLFLFLADGFEEIEALGTVDVLRRGGVEVKTVSVYDRKEVKGAHEVTVVADCLLREIKEEEAELLIFPGGMPGALNLSECKPLMEMLGKHFDQQKPVAAICAAPALVLGKLPLKKEIHMTCYPGFEKYLPGIQVSAEGVVVDGNIITGRGPGFTFAFGLKILAYLKGCECAAEEVAEGMLL